MFGIFASCNKPAGRYKRLPVHYEPAFQQLESRCLRTTVIPYQEQPTYATLDHPDLYLLDGTLNTATGLAQRFAITVVLPSASKTTVQIDPGSDPNIAAGVSIGPGNASTVSNLHVLTNNFNNSPIVFTAARGDNGESYTVFDVAVLWTGSPYDPPRDVPYDIDVSVTGSPPPPPPVALTLTSLEKAPNPSSDPGINFSYDVTGTLPEDATIDFYWASGQTLADRLDVGPAYVYQVNTPTLEAAGSHGPVYVPDSALTAAPKGASYLLASALPATVAGKTLSLKRTLDLDVFFALYNQADFTSPVKAKNGKEKTVADPPLNKPSKDALTALLQFIESDSTINLSVDNRFPAYMLATAKRETAANGVTYLPIREVGSPSYFEKRYGYKTKKGKVLGNTKKGDGFLFRGRGYVQLTGRGKYGTLGNALGYGDSLLVNPDLALNPTLAYRVMVYGMIHGSFTGQAIGKYITLTKTDYVGARAVINGKDHATLIAGYAMNFQSILDSSLLP
jgi:putative chitinase